MALALPQLHPIWRNALRIWLAATLTIGIMLWAGRGQVLSGALVLSVLLINEDDLTPARSLGQLIAGALIGILMAFVLHELSTGWVVLAIALLLTGLLIQALGLIKGLGMGYTGCWALEVMHQGNQVNWAVVFDLAFAAVVGILMAQFATWALWPRRPLEQMPSLEAVLAKQLADQIHRMQQWLEEGGPPPPPLNSQDLLPRILRLQQLHDQRLGESAPAATARILQRWAQAGSLWRQLLRQWLLLEPLLLQLPAPVPGDGRELRLLASLTELQNDLGEAAPLGLPPTNDQAPQLWLNQAADLGASKPLLLAIRQQCLALRQLLRGRRLLLRSLGLITAVLP